MRKISPIVLIGSLCFLMLLLLSLQPLCAHLISNDHTNTIQEPPSPPQQPPTGPGGANYTHDGVRQSRYGWASRQFWIFEPADPTPASAPLIVFNHGYSAIKPYYYQAWIDHLVKQGYIVVYPRYQFGFFIGVRQATQNAIRATRQAIFLLTFGNHVRPELEHFAIVGHSLGGGITAEMAALAHQSRLPTPKAIMPVQPYIRKDTMMHSFHEIPSETLMLVIVGEDDMVVGNESAKMIFYSSDQIPLHNKDFIVQRTDRYGEPALVADHIAPVCIPDSDSTNAMDYFSTWKLFDALIQYAFYGLNQQYCLGNTPEQRFMGLWSDGTPVKELLITDTP